MLKYEVIYSPDEGGYYAEVFDTETGQTIKQTKLTIGSDLTEKNAKGFIEQYNKSATPNYRTITLQNGTVVLAVSDVRALALGPRQAKEMVAQLAKQGISAEVYNGKLIKIN